ncbi:MAG: PilZ domain-containing protein [Butyrivibrio sp.]|nr:PilZ domain-containing protein [Butyrivibrio sp.]
MKITNIFPGTQITIDLVYNDAKYKIVSTVLTSYGDGILITPLYCEGNIVDFCSQATLSYKDNVTGQDHVFKADNISLVDFSGTDFHVFNGKEVIKADSGRKAERYQIQRNAVVYTAERQMLHLLVNDLSMRGISFMAGKNSHQFNIGDTISIELPQDGSFTHIKITCKVVRKFSINGYDAIGCELMDITTKLLEYVLSKKAEKKKSEELVLA